MAHEDGWPLGLGALNVRAGVLRGVDLSGSASFDTTFTSSHPTSSLPSTDFDTEVIFALHALQTFGTSQLVTRSYIDSTACRAQSAWSLPRHGGGGMTLASLIGLVDAMESRRRPSARAGRSSGRLRALLLSLCLRSHLENGSGAPSLREFLEMERRAGGATSHVHEL
ncbi:hypothetical protein SEVIR_5G381800v4 [Setaria viridis]